MSCATGNGCCQICAEQGVKEDRAVLLSAATKLLAQRSAEAWAALGRAVNKANTRGLS